MSVWCLRAALLYLGSGFTLGAILLAAAALHLSATIFQLRPLHAELLLVGWMVQLAFGVAYWILPRLGGQPARLGERLAWSSLVLLNVGVVAAGLGLVAGISSVTVAGRVSEALAVVAFGLQAWPRARASRRS